MTASVPAPREKAMSPEDIPRLFMQFVAAGDYAGLATLYEDAAILAFPVGSTTTGSTAIADAFAAYFAAMSADPASTDASAQPQRQPVLRAGDLALTSARRPDGRVSVEVARRQADGSWRWVVDNPQI